MNCGSFLNLSKVLWSEERQQHRKQGFHTKGSDSLKAIDSSQPHTTHLTYMEHIHNPYSIS